MSGVSEQTYVPDQTTKGGGHGADEDSNAGRGSRFKRCLRSHHTESSETERIGPEQCCIATFHAWCGEVYQRGYSACQPNPQRLPDPEHWSMVEQEIPQRPAADSGDRCNKQETYNIELLYRRLEPATDRKNDHTKQFEPVEEIIHCRFNMEFEDGP